MNMAVWIVAGLIIGSKFLDCLTTSMKITSINQEQNPIARKFMHCMGVQSTIWLIFGLSIIIVGISIWLLFNFYNSFMYKIGFICFGACIAIIQFAVAHTNYTRRLNVITRFLMKRYSWYESASIRITYHLATNFTFSSLGVSRLGMV